MPKLHGAKPHPAFPVSLLERTRPFAPSATTPSKTQAGQPHYPPEYLHHLGVVKHGEINTLPDVGGVFMNTLVGKFLLLLVAYFNPLWLVDSGPYDFGSFMSDARSTIYLRRSIMMATVLSSHAIASAFAAHLRALFCAQDATEMVQAKIAEWNSHRAHQQSFMQAFPPGIFTRISLIVLQGFTLFMSFWCYMLLPSLLLAVDHQMSAYATQVHTDALTALSKGEMSRLAHAPAPAHAMWFWSLPATATFHDAVFCVRADDTFHATFNWASVENRCKPIAIVAKNIDTSHDVLKVQ